MVLNRQTPNANSLERQTRDRVYAFQEAFGLSNLPFKCVVAKNQTEKRKKTTEKKTGTPGHNPFTTFAQSGRHNMFVRKSSQSVPNCVFIRLQPRAMRTNCTFSSTTNATTRLLTPLRQRSCSLRGKAANIRICWIPKSSGEI